ncbi:Glutathione hydrolase 1 proenzyme [Nymphon striatum]|nr:Glutathione hydrolase 1 proenzyme [Nymphon striatum]
MLPPTFGAWLEHIKRAHCQAAIWEQDLVLNPVVPDPTKLGWTKQDDRLVPELSKIAPAPAAVVELVAISDYPASFAVLYWFHHVCFLKLFYDIQDFLKNPISNSKLHVYDHAAVVCGSSTCSAVGKKILQQGGHAVDGAIATGLCLSVVLPESMGIGGGHFSVIYDRLQKEITTLDARESAPLGATAAMFTDHTYKPTNSGLNTGVPGELRGYWDAHKRYGSDLIFDQMTGKPLKLGDLVKQPILADTLEKIANLGVDEFYHGRTALKFVLDVRKYGGILTMDDMRSYKTIWRPPVSTTLRDGTKFYSVGPPGSGPIAAYIINIIDSFGMNAEYVRSAEDMAVLDHRIIEAFKYGFARRSELGDPRFTNMTEVVNKLLSRKYSAETIKSIIDFKTFKTEYYGAKYANTEDHGTAHLSVVDAEGNAVSLTSSINHFFGSKIRSKSTGILISNSMDDFSSLKVTNHFGLRPSTANFIQPGKRSQSSMCPSIFLDSYDNVRLVIGGAGGSKITSAVALVSIRHLIFNQNIKESIDGHRLHHQLLPDWILCENGYSPDILKILKQKGHKINIRKDRTAMIQAISRNPVTGKLFANSDYRKGGTCQWLLNTFFNGRILK